MIDVRIKMNKIVLSIAIAGVITQLYADVKPTQNENIFKEIKNDQEITPKLHEAACKEGSAKSCYELGFLYNAGKGVKKDHEKAYSYYTLSCDAGYARACTRLGLLYGQGKGVKRDMKKALSLYKKGCEGGHVDGCTLYQTFK